MNSAKCKQIRKIQTHNSTLAFSVAGLSRHHDPSSHRDSLPCPSRISPNGVPYIPDAQYPPTCSTPDLSHSRSPLPHRDSLPCPSRISPCGGPYKPTNQNILMRNTTPTFSTPDLSHSRSTLPHRDSLPCPSRISLHVGSP